MTQTIPLESGKQPRMLIARMSAIGDTILTTPVVCRLRERYPSAYLAWVVEEKSSHFIRGHSALDDVFVLPRGWFASPQRVAQLRSTLREKRFDVAIDCQSISKTSFACWLSGAPVRIGCRGQYGAEMSPWLNNTLVLPKHPHLTDRSLELLAPLGIHHSPGLDPVRWGLPSDHAAESRMTQWLAGQRLESYVAINPGASWDSKLWSNERFGRVAVELSERLGLPSLVVWGGDREKTWAEEVVAASRGAARMAPQTSLHELAALLRQARLMLSPDTGPMHLAVAVDTPTVCLHGTTRPEDCGPYGAPHQALIKRFHEGSRKERRRADNSAMLEITTDHALQACLSVHARTADRYPNAPVGMAS